MNNIKLKAKAIAAENKAKAEIELYYSNLQKENEKLKKENEKLKKENEKLIKELEEDNRVPLVKYNKLKNEKEELQLRLSVIKNYKTIIDKVTKDVDALLNGDYEEINGDSATYYHTPKDCCIERLKIIKKDLL